MGHKWGKNIQCNKRRGILETLNDEESKEKESVVVVVVIGVAFFHNEFYHQTLDKHVTHLIMSFLPLSSAVFSPL